MRETLVFALASISFAQNNLPPAAPGKVDFQKDVQPILSQKCYSCHGKEVEQAGLRLDERQRALRGGDYGPVIAPGDSAGSKLIRRLVSGDGGLQMPPTGPLDDEEIGILRAWIDQGAEFRTEVTDETPANPVDPKLANLIATVRSGNTPAVERLLEAHPELVKARDRSGSTPLHHAAGFGTLQTIRFLLDRGADVNAANRRKSTPLFWALYDEAKVRLLLNRGADIQARTVDGRTPVHQAALMGNGLSLLRLMLDKGADAEVKTIAGQTPLMAAAGNANLEVMKILLERGADVNARNGAGGTALMAAASTGNPQAVRMLLDKGAEVNIKTKRNETALASAATAGVEETVQLLLDGGAEVDVADIRGYTPLLYAAGSDTMPAGVVKRLLAKGADRTAKGDKQTAAMLAAKRGDSEVARLLGVQQPEARLLRPVSSRVSRTPADAVPPALALLEKQSHNFIRIGGCNSCHAQDLPSAAAAVARSRGLRAPASIPRLPPHMQTNNPERLMELNIISLNGPIWELFGFGQNRVGRDEYTDAVVRYIKLTQTGEGNWSAWENRRPPMGLTPFQAAALSIYAVRHYGRPEESADNAAVIARAGAWLAGARPGNTQDRAFRLLGLSWANASPASIRSAAGDLAGTQRQDGGWSQLPTMVSDAFATGQALYALHVAGRMPPTHSSYRRGVNYLLRTQAPDGSWHVRSRSIWLQPYFESGFPYGTDQWISAAGTAWAAMALSLAPEPSRISRVN